MLRLLLTLGVVVVLVVSPGAREAVVDKAAAAGTWIGERLGQSIEDTVAE